MEIFSLRPAAAVLVSALASVFISCSGRSPNLRESWTFIAALVKLSLVVSLYPAIRDGNVLVFRFFELAPGIPVHFRVDALGFIFALLSSLLWLITSIYSLGYVRSLKLSHQTRYFAAFAMSLSAALGIAFAGDLLTFFIFYEVLTFATYPLVVHAGTSEAIQAGRKYLTYSLGSAAALLFAIAWTFASTGQISFQAGGFIPGGLPPQHLWILFFLFIYGCGVKCALFPVHAWLPDAMVAPTPVSALLHAVAVVKAGAFGILRITGFVFGPSLMRNEGLGTALSVIAGTTIILASLMAFNHDSLKKRLAYSTISQLSYIVLGASAAASAAYMGAVLHLVNHACMKIALFFISGLIYVQYRKKYISELAGVGKRTPAAIAIFAAAGLGLSGFPPMSGFLSKWFLSLGTLNAGNTAAFTVFVVSGLLNLAYLAPVLTTAFTKSPEVPEFPANKKLLLLPIIFAGILFLVFGCSPWFIEKQFQLAGLVSAQVFGDGQ